MKVRYTFDVNGQFRLTAAQSFVIDDATVSIDLSPKNVVRKLMVSYSLAPDAKLPSISRSEEPGVKMHVEFPSYDSLARAIEIAKNMEDQLCVFGLDTVDTDSYRVEWVPESEEEKRRLQVNDFHSMPGVPDEAFAMWRPTVLKAALTTAHHDEAFRIQLALFRAGWRESKLLRNASSFMYFFFFLESLFGDNEVKTMQLVAAFRGSVELCDAARQALKTQFPPSAYANLAVPDALQRLVDRRGFLFHNQTKRRRDWAQAVHLEFAVDADVLRRISTHIANARLWPPGLMPPKAAVHDDAYDMFSRFLDNKKMART